MKLLRRIAEVGFTVVCGALLAGCLFHGRTADEPFLSDSAIQPGATASTNLLSESAATLRVGDLITVTFADLPTPVPPHEERIKEDGTITLMLNQAFVAKDKTTGDLQKEIRDRYVPKYFVNLTVTVKGQDRFYSVDGEVRTPGLKVYTGDITVLGAIASAGGFTDYAKKTKVQISRSNRQKVVVDCVKAQKKPELDVPVYPGDRVFVPRRIW